MASSGGISPRGRVTSFESFIEGRHSVRPQSILGGIMRSCIVLLFVGCSSICLAQTDSVLVEKMDGTIRGYPISSIDRIGFSGTPTTIREQELIQTALTSFALYQNYPNPFNPTTSITYSLPQAGDVEMSIYDIQGRRVRSLLKSMQAPGAYSIVWDSRTDGGSPCASGTYLCKVNFRGSILTKKLLLIK